jgi:hypothetical protein
MERILSLRQGEHGPLDTSGRDNIIRPVHIDNAAGMNDAPAMGFDGNRSRIIVLPSDSLAELDGIRITTWLWVDEVVGRHTIIEGYLAFAMFIDADRSFGGTIYNGFNWGGVFTEPGAITLRQWHKLSFTYDGVDTAMLHIDDVRRAEEYSPLGRVSGVRWPYGINVGAWPDADKRVLHGRIQDLTLWRSAG